MIQQPQQPQQSQQTQQAQYRVTSYALAVYLITAGFECRDAIMEYGKPVYLFDPEAAVVFPGFQAVKRKLEAVAGFRPAAR